MSQQLKPKYADKKFDSYEEYLAWLKKTTYKEIVFFDLSHDITKLLVATSGEILQCSFHESMYNGKFINMEKLEKSNTIEIYHGYGWKKFDGLLVEKIITNPKTQNND